MSFYITTESNSEIPYQWEDEYNVKVLRMPYSVEGTEYFYDLGRETNIKAFYDQMRGGASVTTAQRNPAEVVEFWEPFLQEGMDILHIGFSSQLSGTFHCEQLAREELLIKYPERKIMMVDSLAISAPLSLLVREALLLNEQGASMEEIARWTEDHKQKVCALFTVENLEYLRRGGRLSSASAFFGTMLEIKPVLYVSPEGKLVPIEKVKGRKKALKYMLEKCVQTIERPEDQVIVIAQADAPEEAEQFARQIQEAVQPKGVDIHPVGPVIGSHCGPGTIALAYFCTARTDIKA